MHSRLATIHGIASSWVYAASRVHTWSVEARSSHFERKRLSAWQTMPDASDRLHMVADRGRYWQSDF